MGFPAGTRLGSYEIASPLGSGGMGQVYKAKDLKLGRDVAIKALREDFSADPERLRRFEQEARAASGLNHPNIITIYDIDMHGSTPYIAMEYVEGKTLREMLTAGPLTNEKLLNIATQTAEGLAKAHAAGIIHRDIKPANLMVTVDGFVKILDFGVAKLLTPATGIDSEAPTVTREGTRAGVAMGTASYMSPEQALGRDLDGRSDLFSLGIVLYEMATGRQPFHGDTLAALFNEILNKDPQAPTHLNPALPQPLARVIQKALQKDATHRYQTAKELLRDLAEQGTPAETTPGERTIVVLPFENISPDPENEYFSDGLTEEVIADLSQVPQIRVISRSSAMTLKGTRKTIKEVSQELRVQFVLEGSVRKAGNNLRITAQLIDAEKDIHLWAQKYSGTVDDVFDIQEKVSRSIVDALEVKLSPTADKRIAERPIKNVHAYECYLRARQEIMSFTEEGLERALQLIQNGTEIAGESELLLIAKGHVYWQSVNLGVNTKEFASNLDKAEVCANKALALNPDSPQAHYLLGMVHDMRGNLQEAVREHKKARRLDPDNPEVLFWLALLLSIVGKVPAAKPLSDRLLEVDPLYAFNYCIPGWVHFLDGDYPGSLGPLRKAFQMDPENLITRCGYVMALLWNRKLEEASPIVDSMVRDAPENPFTVSVAFVKRALEGARDKALETVTPEFEEAARWDHSIAFFVADGYALLNEKQKGLDWLEIAVGHGFVNYPLLSKWDPFLENIRGEERFKKLMERVKYEWEHFEV